MTLPKKREDLKDFEKAAGLSVEVFVHVKGFKTPNVGRYIHGLGEWQADNISGSVEVLEWWPMPVIGTGISMEDT